MADRSPTLSISSSSDEGSDGSRSPTPERSNTSTPIVPDEPSEQDQKQKKETQLTEVLDLITGLYEIYIIFIQPLPNNWPMPAVVRMKEPQCTLAASIFLSLEYALNIFTESGVLEGGMAIRPKEIPTGTLTTLVDSLANLMEMVTKPNWTPAELRDVGFHWTQICSPKLKKKNSYQKRLENINRIISHHASGAKREEALNNIKDALKCDLKKIQDMINDPPHPLRQPFLDLSSLDDKNQSLKMEVQELKKTIEKEEEKYTLKVKELEDTINQLQEENKEMRQKTMTKEEIKKLLRDNKRETTEAIEKLIRNGNRSDRYNTSSHYSRSKPGTSHHQDARSSHRQHSPTRHADITLEPRNKKSKN